MNSKIGLDFEKVAHARQLAKNIAVQVQGFVDQYTTVAVERTLCRLMGIDGVDDNQVPLPNVVVEYLKDKGVLAEGVLFFIANAMIQTGLKPQQIAEQVALGKLDITKVVTRDAKEIAAVLQPVVDENINRIRTRRERREHYLNTIGEGPKPYLYIIVATGNIYEDVIQAQAGARQGADVIAVIRTTGQSLLDYVPYGATTEGFGGTFALGLLTSLTLFGAMLANLILLPSLLLTMAHSITQRNFKAEPLLQIYDEEEDIDEDKLSIENTCPFPRRK